MYRMIATRRTYTAFTSLETFLVHHRPLMIIAYAYAVCIRMFINDWQTQPRGPAWPIYNGVQLLDPGIMEPLDRHSVIAKAATEERPMVPSEGMGVRYQPKMRSMVRRVAFQKANALQEEMPAEGPSTPPPALAPEVCSDGPGVDSSTRGTARSGEILAKRTMARREVVASPSPLRLKTEATKVEEEAELNDQMLVSILVGAVAVYFLLRRTATARGKQGTCNDERGAELKHVLVGVGHEERTVAAPK